MIRVFALTVALICPHIASACFAPILSVSDGTLTYTSPDRDLYGPDGVAAFVDGYQPGMTVLIDGPGRQTQNINLFDNSLAELVVLTEADRLVYDGPPECTPTELRGPDEIFPDVDPFPSLKPIELFSDEAGAGLQPQSGMWKAIAGTPEMRGCPAMMQAMIGQSTPATPAEYLQARRLDFAVPFHPDQLEMTSQMQAGLGTQMNWVSVGDAAWQAEIVPEIFDQIPQGEGGGSNMLWRLTVQSETQIELRVTINIILPAVAAQVMDSSGQCQTMTRNIWQRVSD